MKHYRTVLIIGIIEIAIGSITIIFNLLSVVLNTNTKTPSVFFFVVVAGMTSTLIGIGILKFKKLAYQLLLYFSSVVLLSKILIFLDVIQLNGALETTIPADIKRFISMGYHIFVIYYLRKDNIKQIFHV